MKYLLLILALVELSIATGPNVTTTKGIVEGREVMTEDGNMYLVFQGIPFAKPPVGDLRFEAPVEAEPWKETLLTVEFGPYCIQSDPPNPGFLPTGASEDCLKLNVFAPKQKGDSPYPVMLYFHGGAFVNGGPADYPVEGILSNLVSRGIIVVTASYRLGPLGYWTTETERNPGNHGVRDQAMALAWINKEIRAFGGDPSKVTISGESAGGGSVSVLAFVAPDDHWQRSIMMSGTSHSHWVLKPKQSDAKEVGLLFARLVGCNATTNHGREMTRAQEQRLNRILRFLPILVEVIKVPNFESFIKGPLHIPLVGFEMYWTPREDGTFIKEGARQARRSNKQIMLGTDKDEWGLLAVQIPIVFNITPAYNMTASELRNDVIPLHHTKLPQINSQLSTRAAQYAYVDIPLLTEDTTTDDLYWFNKQIQYLSELYFVYPTQAEAVSWWSAKNNDVFLYSFDFLSETALLNTSWKGVAHASEVPYCFNISLIDNTWALLFEHELVPSDIAIVEVMGALWTNFVKFGDPTIKATGDERWVTFNPAQNNYFSINYPESKMFDGYNAYDVEFGKYWDALRNATCI